MGSGNIMLYRTGETRRNLRRGALNSVLSSEATTNSTCESLSKSAVELTRHHIIARSSGGSGEERNILRIPWDLHDDINRSHRVSIRRAKETGGQIQDIQLLTVSASDLTIRVPVKIYAGSIRTGAIVGAGSFTINLQLDPKEPWDRRCYPRRFEKVADGSYMVSGSPSGYLWIYHMRAQGSGAYQLFRQF